MAAQSLEPLAITGAHHHARVDVEAVDLCGPWALRAGAEARSSTGTGVPVLGEAQEDAAEERHLHAHFEGRRFVRLLERSSAGRSSSKPRRFSLLELYDDKGPYGYQGGWNPKALVALAAGILPNLPGFLGVIKVVEVAPIWTKLSSYAWFVGFGISFVVYVVLTRPHAASLRAAG
jgi:hypothetical protein